MVPLGRMRLNHTPYSEADKQLIKFSCILILNKASIGVISTPLPPRQLPDYPGTHVTQLH